MRAARRGRSIGVPRPRSGDGNPRRRDPGPHRVTPLRGLSRGARDRAGWVRHRLRGRARRGHPGGRCRPARGHQARARAPVGRRAPAHPRDRDPLRRGTPARARAAGVGPHRHGRPLRGHGIHRCADARRAAGVGDGAPRRGNRDHPRHPPGARRRARPRLGPPGSQAGERLRRRRRRQARGLRSGLRPPRAAGHARRGRRGDGRVHVAGAVRAARGDRSARRSLRDRRHPPRADRRLAPLPRSCGRGAREPPEPAPAPAVGAGPRYPARHRGDRPPLPRQGSAGSIRERLCDRRGSARRHGARPACARERGGAPVVAGRDRRRCARSPPRGRRARGAAHRGAPVLRLRRRRASRGPAGPLAGWTARARRRRTLRGGVRRRRQPGALGALCRGRAPPRGPHHQGAGRRRSGVGAAAARREQALPEPDFHPPRAISLRGRSPPVSRSRLPQPRCWMRLCPAPSGAGKRSSSTTRGSSSPSGRTRCRLAARPSSSRS